MSESVFVDADPDFGSDLLELFVTVSFAEYSFAGGRKVWRMDHLHWMVAQEGAEEKRPGFRGVYEIVCTLVWAGNV